MENENPNGSNFMESTIKEMAHLFQSGRANNNMDEIEAAMGKLLREKLKESFKNGIQVGMKKAALMKPRDGRSGNRWKKEFRKK
jgi:hypothetical protein